MLRRVLKWLLIAVVAIVVLLGVGYGVIYASTEGRLNKVYNVPAEKLQLTIPNDAAAVERGKHWVTILACVDCHKADLGGGTLVDIPGIGFISTANLTKGKGGIANDFTDADWVRALREGIRPDGKPVRFMPSQLFARLSDDDLSSIIAYVKSVQPVDRPQAEHRYDVLGRLLLASGQVKLAAEEIDHNAPPPGEITVGPSAEYGKYLASATCIDCHGPSYSGGPMVGAPPDVPPAQNLTPTGIGTWSEADFIKALRLGVRPDGSKINTAMPWPYYGQMTDDELKAVYSFLKTLPPKPDGNH